MQLLELLSFYLTVQLLALGAAPLLAVALPRLPDRGYGLAKAAGLLLAGYASWLLVSGGWIAATQGWAWGIAAALAALAHLIVQAHWGGWRRFMAGLGRPARQVELLFGAAYVLFAAVRALNPEIIWGEKPMDLTFLNYFIRLEALPPQDPWAAGLPMHYYYFGYYIFAMLHKLTGVDSAVGYNLAMALLPALMRSGVYSVVLFLVRRPAWAAWISAGFLAVSNLEVCRRFWLDA